MRGRTMLFLPVGALLLSGGCGTSGIIAVREERRVPVTVRSVDAGDYLDDPVLCFEAAKLGQPQAQYVLAQMLRHGRKLRKNDEQAALWFRRAAEQGIAGAKYNLGVMLMNGEGVEKDEAQAVEWLRQAAQENIRQSYPVLGAAYAAGKGVERDPGEAARWYSLAAERGDPEAIAALGWLYLQGDDGVERDIERGIDLLIRAGLAGVAAAQYNLGILYAAGSTVEKDLLKAYAWMSLAAASGLEKAAEPASRLGMSLGSDAAEQAGRYLDEQRSRTAATPR